ncbi:MAG: hypothetical protein H8E62_03340 [Planctomycetes bacterium]|nr:hypothetical protein [Planctomycetota bacterium]
MKSKNSKQKLFAAFVGTMLVALQSCLFIHGCSLPAQSTDSELSKQRLYSSKCASCHRLIGPQEHTANVWREYVYKYGEAIPVQQKYALIEYLEHHSEKTP